MKPRWLQTLFGGKDEPAAAPAHLNLGRKGEEAARKLLQRSGMELLDRNWRSAH